MILTEAVNDYLDQQRHRPDRVLAEMEAHAAREGIPSVVPATGRMLEVLVRARGSRRALEVGTAIGVSTLYIARGLADDGQVVSFEIDRGRHEAARDYLERAGAADRVDLRLQDARAGLVELEGKFDFVFVDGVKAQYADYFDALLPLLDDRAVLAVDNVLMSGAVADPGRRSESLSMARAFNERLLTHPELVSTLTPIGDGVLIAVKQ